MILNGYDGWQVIDATPQEVSGGVYRCGPAPVTAIKRGELGRMQYDLPFVFAEVNADVIKWVKLSSSKWEKLDVDTSRVGKNISTKEPDGKPYDKNQSLFPWNWGKDDGRLDITHEYKYKEGTLEERLAVQNAGKASKKVRQVDEAEHMDVVMDIVGNDGILLGSNFDVEVKVKNQSKDQKVRTITVLDIGVEPKLYTGETGDEFAEKRYNDIRLKYEEEETFKFTLKPDDYLDHLEEQYMMNITATAQVKETGKVHIKEEDYRLRRPDIEVEAPKSGKRYKPFEINVSLKNPLSKPMTKCVVHVEANGIVNVEEKISDIPANSTWKHSITIKAKRYGRITMNVTLDCVEIKDITGYANIEIEP
ncbi:TGM1 [Mytilus edulis]|uniref:TGM1 n=1 Tax=Mytilus edulis TaxID=6550 RepID=A0A8S3UYL8_MYTED|nr:TGM1 [Mytilus edulis]